MGLLIDCGRVSRNGRIISGCWLIILAFSLLAINWHHVVLGHSFHNWDYKLILSNKGCIITFVICLLIILSHFLYPFLIRIPINSRRRVCLWISVVINLSMLGFFKYFNFFTDSLLIASSKIGIDFTPFRLDIILPVGISFYTFQTMSYTIDIYNRKLKATNQFLDFALFVSYFPQLVAGPIERAKNLLPKFLNKRTITFEQSARGLYLILLGLVKKVAIADGLSETVEQVFGSSGTLSWIDVVVGSVFFAIQIYCDFSGYTDIARGVSKLLGIDLILNFRVPYFSSTPQEFWRRWHISLSTWLRDYLYISLGGNRKGKLKTYRNLMITMILGGLWHGASWNFIFWGVYHGTILCAYRMAGSLFTKLPTSKHLSLNKFIKTFSFFIVTCYGWLLFRAESLESIINLTQILIFDVGNTHLTVTLPRFGALLGLVVLIFVDSFEYFFQDNKFYLKFPTFLRGALIAALITIFPMGLSNDPAQFIYFQF